MPTKRASVKNEKQYEALKDQGMSKERAARIANSPGSSSSSKQGGTTTRHGSAGRRGGRAAAES